MGKFIDFLKETFLADDTPMTDKDKVCPECGGFGSEDILITCKLCKGKGFVRMSYREMHNLPED